MRVMATTPCPTILLAVGARTPPSEDLHAPCFPLLAPSRPPEITPLPPWPIDHQYSVNFTTGAGRPCTTIIPTWPPPSDKPVRPSPSRSNPPPPRCASRRSSSAVGIHSPFGSSNPLLPPAGRNHQHLHLSSGGTTVRKHRRRHRVPPTSPSRGGIRASPHGRRTSYRVGKHSDVRARPPFKHFFTNPSPPSGVAALRTYVPPQAERYRNTPTSRPKSPHNASMIRVTQPYLSHPNPPTSPAPPVKSPRWRPHLATPSAAYHPHQSPPRATAIVGRPYLREPSLRREAFFLDHSVEHHPQLRRRPHLVPLHRRRIAHLHRHRRRTIQCIRHHSPPKPLVVAYPQPSIICLLFVLLCIWMWVNLCCVGELVVDARGSFVV